MDNVEGSSENSLIESDIESIESFNCLDIEDLDVTEYALPSSELPSLAEVLSCEDSNDPDVDSSTLNHYKPLNNNTDLAASALQVEFLQAASQQLLQAERRSAAGAATCLTLGPSGRLTAGTAHGHVLSFQDQILRWVCNSNVEYGAVSCLCYNDGGDRVLIGYARGLICQYESDHGTILRRVTLGGDLWGILRVTWAGPSGVALDTGGSVWLIKFMRPLGVRSARSSCLFSGARGEVVAMAARDARILALATLSRVIVVAGGKAAGVRLTGPADTLPVLTWFETEDRLLVCARHRTLQWLAVDIDGITITLRCIRQFQLKTTPLWLGWIGGNLAIFDIDEKLRLWGSEYDNPVDVSHVEPVYASAFFKGVWTEGRVSGGLSCAGRAAVGGVTARGGSAGVLGRRGVLRVTPRPLPQRARALLKSRPAAALALLDATDALDARETAQLIIVELVDRPHLFEDKHIVELVIKLVAKFDLSSELWGVVWERCGSVGCVAECAATAVARGQCPAPPTPDVSQALLERVYCSEPALVDRLLATLPFTAIDPHRAMKFAVDKRLWRAVGTLAGTMGGVRGALRELTKWTCLENSTTAGESGRSEAGTALALAAADGLAGRSFSGTLLPQHARFATSHAALTALLTPMEMDGFEEGISPLGAIVRCDVRAAVSLIEHAWPHAPLVGPMGKFNRQCVLRELLKHAGHLTSEEARVEVVEAVSRMVSGGGLQNAAAVAVAAAALVGGARGERPDLALLPLTPLLTDPTHAHHRPRLALRHAAHQHDHAAAIHAYTQIDEPTARDTDYLFDYLQQHRHDQTLRPHLEAHLLKLLPLRPRAVAALIDNNAPHLIEVCLNQDDTAAIEVGNYLLENGTLQGDLAAKHLRNLCKISPEQVKNFILTNPGVVRPEDSVKIVEELGPQNVKPYCLESVGDFGGALSVWTELLSKCDDDEARAELVREACELCMRAGPAIPRSLAADMWMQLLKYKERMPKSALMDAFSYVPTAALIEAVCENAETSLAAVQWARAQADLWHLTSRAQRAGLYAAGIRARRVAYRGVTARDVVCAACSEPLVTTPPVRVLPCIHFGRAVHVSCPLPPTSCQLCARLVSDTHLSLPPSRSPARLQPVLEHELLLVAPPRPDLEGVV